MRQGTCVSCGLATTIRSFYSFEGKTFCEPCVWKASKEAEERGQPSEYVSLQDNSICIRCGADNDQSDFPLVGGKPLCPQCGGLVTNRPYPNWLKVSLALLLLLLAVALLHRRKYFRAGKDMYKGERLVHEGRFADAIPYLQRTVATAPESDKGVLLLAKAALLTGNVEVAQEA
jgi:Tetratricopeptide repeat